MQVCLLLRSRNLTLAMCVQAYSDLWVSPRQGKPSAFTISEGHSPASVLRFLDLLSRTDPTLPGLSSLSLPCAIPTAEAANRLCSVLLHHSKLEAIYMPRLSCEACGPFPPAATVFRTLPQLTGITSLTLSSPCLPVTPTDAVTEAAAEAVQAMAAAISTLPRLSHFHLSSTPSAPPPHSATNGRSSRRSTASGTSPAPKRRKIAACMRQGGGAATPPSLDPVIAALSTAPSLTALKFTLPSAALGYPLPCSGIRGQFCTLQQLTYESTDRVDRGGAEGPPPGMEVLDTSGVRLAGLTRLDYANASSDHGEDCGSLRRMLAAAALHPALKEVEIRLGKPFSENTTSGFELDVHFPTALEDVTVCVERGMTEAVAQVLQSGLRSLADSAYRMTLELHSRFSERQLEGVQHVATALPPLATFTSLQELDICVDVQPTDINDQTKALCHAILAQPLQPLRLLTSLCIHMPAQACVPLSLVAKQLQEMGQLQTLAIGGFEHGGSPDLRSCVAPLTALDYLHVNVRPVTADFVRAWANTVAAMPQIVQSNLCSCDVPVLNPSADNECYADVDWFRGLLDLPSRGRYDVQCHNGETPKGELEAVRQQLVDRGARVSGFPGHISFENDC